MFIERDSIAIVVITSIVLDHPFRLDASCSGGSDWCAMFDLVLTEVA